MDKADLPPLPPPCRHGGTYESSPFVYFTEQQMREYAHAAIAAFLERAGQYVTNDASREAAIAPLRDAAEEVLEALYTLSRFVPNDHFFAIAVPAMRKMEDALGITSSPPDTSIR